MSDIQVLDCTLRDGGYCNDCKFGYGNIKSIVQGLIEANIDIIECGFLTNKYSYDIDSTRFTQLEQIADIIPDNRTGKMFVVLMNYGDYDICDIPEYDGKSVDGIRIAFHKKDCFEALEFCKAVKKKGYRVFVQDMVSLSYSDEDYIGLIKLVNEIEPYAFYIVDSFGQIKQKDLMRLLYVVENNLKNSIHVGFHSHNNMQLSYSNAQVFADFHTSKKMIVDSSVYGMGRGAGNLNTELFVEYLNDFYNHNYALKPLLSIIDSILNEFYQKNSWGYSLSNYLSASHAAHPKYAAYFDDKKTLTVEDMSYIFDHMNVEKKDEFDKEYAEKLYLSYMGGEKTSNLVAKGFKQKIFGKDVLLIAPGKSATDEKEKIILMAGRDNIVSISINFDYSYINTDYIFMSNLRRYRESECKDKSKLIITSNIRDEEAYLKVGYTQLLNDHEYVRDNAGLMAINFLIINGVKKVFLAGFDGYTHDSCDNYASDQLEFQSKNSILDKMNAGMTEVLKNYNQQIELEFVTSPKKVII